MEMKDRPDFVFSSVTRKIHVPNVGSAIAVLAGPKAGGGGSGFGSVPVYAEYVDGEIADCGLGAAEIVHTVNTNNNKPMRTEILIHPPKILTASICAPSCFLFPDFGRYFGITHNLTVVTHSYLELGKWPTALGRFVQA